MCKLRAPLLCAPLICAPLICAPVLRAPLFCAPLLRAPLVSSCAGPVASARLLPAAVEQNPGGASLRGRLCVLQGGEEGGGHAPHDEPHPPACASATPCPALAAQQRADCDVRGQTLHVLLAQPLPSPSLCALYAQVRLGTYSPKAATLPPAALVAARAMTLDPRQGWEGIRYSAHLIFPDRTPTVPLCCVSYGTSWLPATIRRPSQSCLPPPRCHPRQGGASVWRARALRGGAWGTGGARGGRGGAAASAGGVPRHAAPGGRGWRAGRIAVVGSVTGVHACGACNHEERGSGIDVASLRILAGCAQPPPARTPRLACAARPVLHCPPHHPLPGPSADPGGSRCQGGTPQWEHGRTGHRRMLRRQSYKWWPHAFCQAAVVKPSHPSLPPLALPFQVWFDEMPRSSRMLPQKRPLSSLPLLAASNAAAAAARQGGARPPGARATTIDR